MGKLINGIIKAALSSKVKEIATSGSKGKSYGDAVQDLKKAAKKFNDLLENDPEFEKELDRLGL